MDSMPNLPLFPHQIYNNGLQQQPNNSVTNLPLFPHQIYNNNGHQQQLPNNLLSSEDGVTSFPQNSNHHHRRPIFFSVLEQWRRLDTDNIPYEQLLELQERIGNINTGLSEENITNCLKTRTVTSGDVKDEKIFNETCIVCQDEYKDNDTIGTLECGHEYHRECIKEWLLLKNFCPICKRPALSTTMTTN